MGGLGREGGPGRGGVERAVGKFWGTRRGRGWWACVGSFTCVWGLVCCRSRLAKRQHALHLGPESDTNGMQGGRPLGTH